MEEKEKQPEKCSNESQILRDIEDILSGRPVDVTKIDVGLEKLGSYVPVTKRSVCYIVAAVVINDLDQVLMIQEAKYSCHGMWYLPAGRVEPAESLIDACKREVEEEAGLLCEPTTLIAIEYGSGCWYRFTFAARITGGKLKTLEEKDKESLQAAWVDYEHIKKKKVQLRAHDVVSLIDIGHIHYGRSPSVRHNPCLPIAQGHRHLINRPIIVHKTEDSDLHVLACTEEGYHLPCGCENQAYFSPKITAVGILKEAIGKVDIIPRICGLLSVQHEAKKGAKQDGVCLTTLMSLDSTLLPKLTSSKYQWVPIEDVNLKETFQKLFQDGGTVTFLDLHG